MELSLSTAGSLGILVVIIGYLPQIFHLIKIKDSTGMSISSWLVWLVGTAMLLVHAIGIKDLVFIIVETIYLVAIVTILLLIFKYKKSEPIKQ